MSTRGRLLALAVALGVVAAAGAAVLLRSRTPDCGVVTPRASLPSALRALGDFDQAYNANDPAALRDAAERAASAQYPNLIGTIPQTPVLISPSSPGGSLALVVPLRAQLAGAPVVPGIAGLVLFFADCQGNAFFNEVENDAANPAALAQFPPVGRDQAAAQLGTRDIQLTYTASPLRPQWSTIALPLRSISAR